MYIAIAGNIGSGKTSLTEILCRRCDAKAYYEESNNPYLGDFYQDMKRWSFNLQIYFIGSRIRQSVEVLSDRGNVVQDRTIYEDAHIFATNLHEMGLMSSRDFATYMKIFELSSNLIPRPDLLIYLKASVPTLVSQIRKRGREYEMSIDADYLQRLNDKYNHWIEDIYQGEVLTVDMDKEDFILNPGVIDRIVEHIDKRKAALGR
ncbi:MAG: deoxynucleoside kinase [Rikenellaceae bacterium]|nr:deoxynucleoside kinase [Rikenellaceae bacterium]